jgi:hypothetical protein
MAENKGPSTTAIIFSIVIVLIILVVLYFVYVGVGAVKGITGAIGGAIGGITQIFNSKPRPSRPADSCPPGMVKEGAICYEACPDGYDARGPLCWPRCPTTGGFSDLPANCQKQAHNRGVGVIPSICPTDKPSKDAGLCYPNCDPGFRGVGPICWQECPSGYTDTGVSCLRPADTINQERYKRTTVGRIPDKGPCDPGQRDDGTSCWEDRRCQTRDNGYYNYTWGCGTQGVPCYDGSIGCKNDCYRTWISRLETTCSGCGCIKKTLGQRQTCRANEELIDGLCYPKCAPGFSSHRGDILYCTKDGCPPGYSDTGLTCYRPPNTITKQSRPRGAGVVPQGCPPDKPDKSAGLCYSSCPPNHTSDGAILCWPNCPSDGRFTNLLTTCNKNTRTRRSSVLVCPPGTEQVSPGLCYGQCEVGYEPQGALCVKK